MDGAKLAPESKIWNLKLDIHTLAPPQPNIKVGHICVPFLKIDKLANWSCTSRIQLCSERNHGLWNWTSEFIHQNLRCHTFGPGDATARWRIGPGRCRYAIGRWTSINNCKWAVSKSISFIAAALDFKIWRLISQGCRVTHERWDVGRYPITKSGFSSLRCWTIGLVRRAIRLRLNVSNKWDFTAKLWSVSTMISDLDSLDLPLVNVVKCETKRER